MFTSRHQINNECATIPFELAERKKGVSHKFITPNLTTSGANKHKVGSINKSRLLKSSVPVFDVRSASKPQSWIRPENFIYFYEILNQVTVGIITIA